MLIAKSQCQEAMARMPEAMLGPAAAEEKTTIPLNPTALPSKARGYV